MRKSGRRRTRLTCRISRYPVTGLGAAATRLRRIHHLHTRIDCDRFPFPFPIFVPRQNRFAPPPWIATTEQNAPRALTSIHMSRHRRQLSSRVPLVRQGLDRDNNNEKCRISPDRDYRARSSNEARALRSSSNRPWPANRLGLSRVNPSYPSGYIFQRTLAKTW